jgi:hypothetical protein
MFKNDNLTLFVVGVSQAAVTWIIFSHHALVRSGTKHLGCAPAAAKLFSTL